MLKRIKQSIGNCFFQLWFLSVFIFIPLWKVLISAFFQLSNQCFVPIFGLQLNEMCQLTIQKFSETITKMYKNGISSIQQITEISTRTKCPPKTAQRGHAENATIELSNCHVIIEELNEFYVNSIIVVQLHFPQHTYTINNRQYLQFAYWKARNEKATKIKFIYLFCLISVLCVSTFYFIQAVTPRRSDAKNYFEFVELCGLVMWKKLFNFSTILNVIFRPKSDLPGDLFIELFMTFIENYHIHIIGSRVLIRFRRNFWKWVDE